MTPPSGADQGGEPRPRAQEVATKGPCRGHVCDQCATCRRGRCCRKDHPDYRLPALGAWEGPRYGELGVLRHDGDRVECHCCSGWYRSLAAHVWQTHGLWADEYRALFGLNATTGLVGQTFRDWLRQHALVTFLPYVDQRLGVATLTLEQRRAYNRGRRLRLETTRNPEHRRAQREKARKGRARQGELLADPSYEARLAQKISIARGGRVVVACVICGAPITLIPSKAHDGRQHTCGPACLHTFRHELMARSLLRPDSKAKAAATTRAQAQAGARRQVRPGAAQVRALSATAFDVLAPRERELVQRYYSLVDPTALPTHQELAQEYGLTKQQVSRLLMQSVARLLGDQTPRRARSTLVTCVICGGSSMRSISEAHAARQHTCSKACFVELIRRRTQVHNPWTMPAVRAKARAIQVRKTRPHAAALAALPPAAWTSVAEPDRTVLRRYYGLEPDGVPQSKRALAEHFGWTTWRVDQVLARTVARVLAQAPIAAEPRDTG